MTDPRIIVRCVLPLAGIVAGVATMAQETVPSAAAASAAEKAQKTADRTMYWIRVLGQTSAPRLAAAPKPAAVAATAASVPTKAGTDRAKVAAAEPAPSAAALSARPAVEPKPVAVAVAVVTAPPQAPPAPAPAPVPVPVPVPAPVPVSLPAPAPVQAEKDGNASSVSAMPAGGLDPGVGSGGVTAGLLAPAIATTPVELPPPVVEEPDPGLVMIQSVDPEFPISTMRRLRKGDVELKFEVGPDGQVAAVSVLRSSSSSLNAAAMNAVRKWRFKPTPKGHTATVDLAFNLDA